MRSPDLRRLFRNPIPDLVWRPEIALPDMHNPPVRTDQRSSHIMIDQAWTLLVERQAKLLRDG